MTPIAQRLATFVDAFASAPEATVAAHLRGDGPVGEFERVLRERCATRFAVAVTNATTGLLVLAAALGLRRRQVIVAPNNWLGMYGPLLLLGNRLLVAEAALDGTLAAESVEALLDEYPAVRAVLACDLPDTRHNSLAIAAACRRAGVRYIADLAATSSNYLRGIWKCPAADALMMSFGPGKAFSTFEGGCIATSDSVLYRRIIRLCQHPARYREEFTITAAPTVQAFNARLNPLAAVIGIARLEAFGPKEPTS